MKSKVLKSDSCPNCGQELKGENFCPSCGQKNDARRLTAWHFITESLSSSIAFDGRFLNTLINLTRYPGKVPRNFIDGKRTRYMNPIRIYFLSSILLLFLIQVKNDSPSFLKLSDSNPEIISDDVPESADSLQTQTETEKDTLPDANKPMAFTFSRTPTDSSGQGNTSTAASFDRMREFHQDHPAMEVNEALDSLGIEAGFWNRFLYTQAAKSADFSTEDFNRYFLSKLFWVLFLFVPVLGLLLKLIYVRRSFYYPEHLIFAFFNQAVFFLLFSIAIFTTPALLLLFGVYLLIAMRKFYKQGWGKTIFKFIILNILLAPAFALFTILSMLVVFIMM
ncbi:MAG: DUF3667 domain-containing protein [Owenweeksia sp.]